MPDKEDLVLGLDLGTTNFKAVLYSRGGIVTKEAAEEGGYEASNALFSYQAGDIFVDKTFEALDELK
jgi:sugar (pentulose or hexulose) kinase